MTGREKLRAVKAPRAVVVGGSLGGLTAALTLRDIGWDVKVYERSARHLTSQGVGIVAHPSGVRYLLERTNVDLTAMTSHSSSVIYIDDRGEVIHELAAEYRFTSFYALYRELLKAFGTDDYLLSMAVDSIEQDEHGVFLEAGGSRNGPFDLVVCADGVHSISRRHFLPDLEPTYAGYVAWRGVASEAELSKPTFAVLNEAITYHLMPASHILTYPIPNTDGSVEPGHRLINWIWYLNVDPGPELDGLMTDAKGREQAVSLAPGAISETAAAWLATKADERLRGPLAEMVAKTERPFIQKVIDIDPPRLAFGRACLIGDAATVLRPHVAVGTAKAAEAGWRLAEALSATDNDVEAALRLWEPAQLALERSTLARTREAGQRAQVEQSWQVGDPLPFGLYEEGDSVMPDIASDSKREGVPVE